MANFTPISAAIGGALIGLSAVLLMLLNGRIAGVTGVFAGLIDPTGTDRAWRATFIAGLIVAPLSAALVGFTLPMPQMPTSLIVVAAGGLLVGFGTRLSNGCTSGHGVCGIARLSRLRRIRKHRILSRKPAASHPLLFHPARHNFFNSDTADHACLPYRNKHRTACMRSDI